MRAAPSNSAFIFFGAKKTKQKKHCPHYSSYISGLLNDYCVPFSMPVTRGFNPSDRRARLGCNPKYYGAFVKGRHDGGCIALLASTGNFAFLLQWIDCHVALLLVMTEKARDTPLKTWNRWVSGVRGLAPDTYASVFLLFALKKKENEGG